MREQRRENGTAREKFGDFYIEKDCSYVGFFENDAFIVTQIPFKESKKVDSDDFFAEILAQNEY